MKKVTALMLALVMTVCSLAGCGNGTSGDTADGGQAEAANTQDNVSFTGTKEIGVVFCDLNNPVFVVMKEAIEEAAKEQGYNVTVLNSEGSSKRNCKMYKT